MIITPRQRLIFLVIGCVLLLGGGRLWLSSTFTQNPKEIATNMQEDLENSVPSDQQDGSSSAEKGVSLDQSQNPTQTHKKTAPFTLTMLLPPWVQKNKITELMTRLDPENSFSLSVVQPPTLATFLRAIDVMTTGNRQADIILLPREEIERIHPRSTQIDRSATPPPVGQFHPQIGHLLTESQSLFLPHALDPRVSITQAPTNNLTLGTFLQTHRSPLSFGSGIITQDPLTNTITSIWLDQLYEAGNISLLPKIFRVTPDAGCTMDTACLSSGATALRLPLSEISENEIDQARVSVLPTLDGKIPTSVWGRVVRGNDRLPAIQQRLGRIQKYLTVMSEDQLPYESPLLPAYFPRLSRIILQDEWAWIQHSAYKLTILDDSSQKLQTWFSTLPLDQLLNGSYRPELYLDKWEEINTQEKK